MARVVETRKQESRAKSQEAKLRCKQQLEKMKYNFEQLLMVREAGLDSWLLYLDSFKYGAQF